MGHEALKIRVVTGHDGECEWRGLLEANLQEYCDRWDYELVKKFNNWGPTTRHPFWRKLELIRPNFEGCDWLLWLDADCFVMNMTTPLSKYASDDFNLGVTGPFGSTCMDGAACSLRAQDVYSAGVLLLRQCSWTSDILEEWWESENQPWRPAGCEGWLGDSGYLSCVLMQNPEVLTHIRVFPLHEIGWANIAHDPSQFIAHCYGSPGPQRRERFELYEKFTIR